MNSFDLIMAYENDPFVGHLSTPITTSNFTKQYLANLPAYQSNLSPLLRGINIGLIHGYFLFGPFTYLNPLRLTKFATLVGLFSTFSIIFILTLGLIIYGLVSFSGSSKNLIFIFGENYTLKMWQQFSQGFMLSALTGGILAYLFLETLSKFII